MGKLSDAVILKRADYGARNFRVLGILSALGSLLMIGLFWKIGSESGNISTIFVISLGLGVLMVTASFFTMAVSCRRGEYLAITVVIAVMVLQFVLNLILTAINNINAGVKAPPPNLFGFIIPVLVFIALVQGRTAIMEIKKRGLFEKAYGGRKPGKTLAIIGSIIFVIGVVNIHASTFLIGVIAAKNQVKSIERANRFVVLINNEEKQFLENLGTWFQNPTAETKKRLDESFSNLKIAANTLHKAAAEKEPKLQEATAPYLQAIKYWEEGIACFSSIPMDQEKGNKALEMGDQFKGQAVDAYNKRYAKK